MPQNSTQHSDIPSTFDIPPTSQPDGVLITPDLLTESEGLDLVGILSAVEEETALFGGDRQRYDAAVALFSEVVRYFAV